MNMLFRLGALKERRKAVLGVRAIRRKEGRAISVCSTLIYYYDILLEDYLDFFLNVLHT